MAVEHGIGLVVVDNADDVDRLEADRAGGRTQDVLVRVIPGVAADTHARVLTGQEGSKFGLAPAAAAELIERIEHSPRLRMRGTARPRRVSDPGRRAVRASRWRRWPSSESSRCTTWAAVSAPATRYADQPPGGGRRTWTRSWEPRASTCRPRRELIIEPGRSMVASAAATLYRVVTVKRGARTFVAVDGGMGDNLEVALYGQRFEAGVVGRLDAPTRRR